LADILEAYPPTLKTLSIYSMALVVEAFRVVMESIEHLTISSSTLDDELGEVLTAVSKFGYLKIFLPVYRMGIYIYLETPLLQEAIIDINELINRDYEYGFSFKYPGVTEVQYYYCTMGKKVLTSEEEIADIPTIQIECCKEMKLVLDRFIRIRAC
jgi:hypothetical protein